MTAEEYLVEKCKKLEEENEMLNAECEDLHELLEKVSAILVMLKDNAKCDDNGFFIHFSRIVQPTKTSIIEKFFEMVEEKEEK